MVLAVTDCMPNCLRPCRDTFERLAAEAPELLIAWVQTGYGLDVADLSNACEALGKVGTEQASVLLQSVLYRHVSPLVREGAVYGLAEAAPGHRTLRWLAEHDPSPGVRKAAQDALDAWVAS